MFSGGQIGIVQGLGQGGQAMAHIKAESTLPYTVKIEPIFDPKFFKKTPKWKMFFIRFFGKKITSIDSYHRCISYKLWGRIYFDKIINTYAILEKPPQMFAFTKTNDPEKW